jgi:YcxB-like protein
MGLSSRICGSTASVCVFSTQGFAFAGCVELDSTTVVACVVSFLAVGFTVVVCAYAILEATVSTGQRTASFDGDAVIWHWDGGSIVLEWKTYIRWIESKNQIVLCPPLIRTGIVPKRALNAEQLSELRTLLTQKIGAGIPV